MAKIQILCGDCRSAAVTRDASAHWDIDTQQWVLNTVYDQGTCHDCGAERGLIEEEIEMAKPAYGPTTTNQELAEAIESLHNALNERDLLKLDALELLSEAATRLREHKDEEGHCDEGDHCNECGLYEVDGHLHSCSLHPDNIEEQDE